MLLRKLELKFQLQIYIFGFSSPTGLVKNYGTTKPEVETGSVKSKMVASEPEPLISTLVDEIEKKSQRLKLHSRSAAIQWD